MHEDRILVFAFLSFVSVFLLIVVGCTIASSVKSYFDYQVKMKAIEKGCYFYGDHRNQLKKNALEKSDDVRTVAIL